MLSYLKTSYHSLTTRTKGTDFYPVLVSWTGKSHVKAAKMFIFYYLIYSVTINIACVELKTREKGKFKIATMKVSMPVTP